MFALLAVHQACKRPSWLPNSVKVLMCARERAIRRAGHAEAVPHRRRRSPCRSRPPAGSPSLRCWLRHTVLLVSWFALMRPEEPYSIVDADKKDKGRCAMGLTALAALPPDAAESH